MNGGDGTKSGTTSEITSETEHEANGGIRDARDSRGEETFVFIDIDGTLLNRAKRVPESAAAACRQARANGHKLVLSTGRSLPELSPKIVEIGFDGIVSASGSCVSWEGDELFEDPLPLEQARELREYFLANDYDFLWQASREIWGTGPIVNELYDVVTSGERPLPENWQVFPDGGDVRPHGLKCLFGRKDGSGGVDEVKQLFGDRMTVVEGSLDPENPHNGEITAAGISKGTAMAKLRRYLKVPQAHFIGIGDSENDADMLRAADYGIAMGNATGLIKDLADYVTDDVDADGFAHAFAALGLV